MGIVSRSFSAAQSISSVGIVVGALIFGWSPGRLARNTLWAISGQSARLLIQTVNFVLIARLLGASEYGAFVGVAALIAILSAFAGLGMGPLLVKHVSSSPQLLQFHWGRSLGVIGMSGLLLVPLALGIAIGIPPFQIPLVLVLSLAVSDLVLMPMYLTCAQIFQARERMGTAATLHIIIALARLSAVLAMSIVVATPTARDLAEYYLAATLVACTVGMGYAAHEFGRPRWMNLGFISDLKQGLAFGSSTVAQYLTSNVDKTLLAHLSSTTAAGIYTAAQRVVEVALIPVFALLAAAIPRFFTHGAEGAHASFAIARRLLPVLVTYCGASAVMLYLMAPLLPVLFGQQYQQSEVVVRGLAILPILHMLHAVAADALSGAGYQKLRSTIEITAALLNVWLNWFLIRGFSFLGSAVALLVTFAFSAICLWSVGTRVSRQ